MAPKHDRHTISDLYQMQSLPLELKVRMTERRIRDWVEYWGEDGVYISFSGGKDSTVLLDICRRLYPNLVAVYSDTGLEFPEIREFVKTKENVVWVKPELTFRKVIEKCGYPCISKEQAEWIQSLPNINIKGMHLHIGSQIRELHVFQYLCDKVNVITENLVRKGFTLDFVDVGGGLGINYDMPENEPVPNFASVFAIINGNLKVGGREIHFEFGRSIVGECGELITRVLYRKDTATGRRLVIVDSSMTELIRPMLYGSYHDIENLTSEEEKHEKYAVVGTACESTDIFNESLTLPKTRRGDLLTIKSAGAYGMSMASRYNQHDLPGAVYSDDIK